MRNQTFIERLAQRIAELDRAAANATLSDDESAPIFDEMEKMVTEIARAQAENSSDIRIQATLLQRRMRANLSPDHSAEVVDFLLASAIVDGLVGLASAAD